MRRNNRNYGRMYFRIYHIRRLSWGTKRSKVGSCVFGMGFLNLGSHIRRPYHISSFSVLHIFKRCRSGSPATSIEVNVESCSSVVTLILILSFDFSPSRLLSPELSSFSPNFSFNHWLAILPRIYNSLNFSKSILWLFSRMISFHD